MTEYVLPFPPSVNDMYVRGRIISDGYRAWIVEASLRLNRQAPKLFLGRALVHIDLDDKRQGDCDNRAKPVLDILVKRGVLQNDSKKHVRRVSIGWEKIDGCRVRLEAA